MFTKIDQHSLSLNETEMNDGGLDKLLFWL